jgi:2-polyprenyl-3-methyl-5-hydroxy-6-metoxy-1,4-benzoquinol methylase
MQSMQIIDNRAVQRPTDESLVHGHWLDPSRKANRMTNSTELSQHEVRHDVLDVLESNDFAAVDRFIAEKSEPAHWKLKLTQSEDVEEWIKDPSQISRIQDNLVHFGKAVKKGKRPLSILDAGCYAGYVYDYIRQYVLPKDSDFTYQGIDIREPAIEAAKEVHSDCKNAQFCTADLFKLTDVFHEGQFDIVLCARVLVHLPYFESAIRNLLAVSSGSAYVLVPFSELARCEIRKKTDLGSGGEMIYVYRSYSPQMVAEVATQNDVEFQITPTTEAYASVVFRKQSRSFYAKGQKLLSRLASPWLGT